MRRGPPPAKLTKMEDSTHPTTSITSSSTSHLLETDDGGAEATSAMTTAERLRVINSIKEIEIIPEICIDFR
jgi:hypothetical protein